MSLPSRVSVTAPAGLPEVAGDALNVGIVWDAENRLTEVRQGPTTVAAFVYDGFGRRQQRIADGVTRTYVSDGSGLIEERVNSGQTLGYVEGLGIDQHLAMHDGATATYYVADHLGSVVQETNASGAVTLARKYDAWGNMLAGAGSAGWSFTGRDWDPEMGLYYYRARYYDPKSGRFASEDPIGFAGGINAYAYVDGAVVGVTDPDGLSGMVMLPLGPGPHLRSPAHGDCFVKCLQDMLGIHTAAAAAGAGASLPVIPKPFVPPGATEGSSPLSKLASKCFPQKLPKAIPAPTAANPRATTRILGRAIGRWAGVVSGIALIIDLIGVEVCTNMCFNQRCSSSSDGCQP